jgi:tetratricopeptide (TPR) repeat protein
MLVQLDWKAAEPFLARWDEIHGADPEYVKALAKHYYDHGPLTLAEATLKKVIDMQPAVWAYLWLAKIYERWGDEHKYVSTLEAGLNAPDASLGHAEISIWLADHYRRKKDWDSALPYAERAAQSYSGKGLLCLAKCYEAKGDLDQAEEWMKRLTDRYPDDDGYKWYVWCRINRHGDVKSAQEAAARQNDPLLSAKVYGELASAYKTTNQPTSATLAAQKRGAYLKLAISDGETALQKLAKTPPSAAFTVPAVYDTRIFAALL